MYVSVQQSDQSQVSSLRAFPLYSFPNVFFEKPNLCSPSRPVLLCVSLCVTAFFVSVLSKCFGAAQTDRVLPTSLDPEELDSDVNELKTEDFGWLVDLDKATLVYRIRKNGQYSLLYVYCRSLNFGSPILYKKGIL